MKRIKIFDHVRSWHDITIVEIEVFVEILLYMSLSLRSRIVDYWNYDSNRFIHIMIINCMSNKRWKQIKRYLKISHSINDQTVNIKESHWWKKLKSLIIDFRKVFKKYWTSDSHVFVDEQLIDFRERFAHAMQLACKFAEMNFKIYSIC